MIKRTRQLDLKTSDVQKSTEKEVCYLEAKPKPSAESAGGPTSAQRPRAHPARGQCRRGSCRKTKEWKLASPHWAMGVLIWPTDGASRSYCQAYARWKEFITQHAALGPLRLCSGAAVSIAQQNLKIMRSFIRISVLPARARIIASGSGRGRSEGPLESC